MEYDKIITEFFKKHLATLSNEQVRNLLYICFPTHTLYYNYINYDDEFHHITDLGEYIYEEINKQGGFLSEIVLEEFCSYARYVEVCLCDDLLEHKESDTLYTFTINAETNTLVCPDGTEKVMTSFAYSDDDGDEFYAEWKDIGFGFFPKTKRSWVQGQSPTYKGEELDIKVIIL